MKQVFSLLLAFVFLQTQTWAIGGGPQSGGATATSLVGTYAGVLIPTSETSQSGNVSSSASIGLFVVSVPEEGAATGSSVTFVDGIAFTGNVTAIADPKRETLTGIVEGISNFEIVTLVPTGIVNGVVIFTEQVSAIFAQGSINAKFGDSRGGFNPTTGQTTIDRRLTGKANLDLFALIDEDTGAPIILRTVKFEVDGFQQSATASSVTISFTPPGTGGNNGNNNGG